MSKNVSCLELNDMNEYIYNQNALVTQIEKHSSPRILGRKINRDEVQVRLSPEMGSHSMV